MRESKDAQAIFRYFREARVAGGRPLLEVKVAILGLGRIGKSQLARRLAPRNDEERQRPWVPDADPTHAFEQRTTILTLLRNGKSHECLLRLFDFGGQPEMHGAHRFFLANQRNVYLVLVSARMSRAANRLGYWLKMVKHHGGGAPAIVVVSHCDREPAADEATYQDPKERLDPLDAAELSQKYGLPVQVVKGYSNVTGTNLDKVRQALEQAVAGLNDVFEVPFAPAFFQVHAWVTGKPGKELQDQPTLERYLTVAGFREVCAAVGQKDEEQQLIWLKLLRNLGLVHYVGDRPEVSRDPHNELAHFLFHPEWVKTPVYNVVRHPDAYEKQGVLPYSQLSRAFKKEVPNETDRARLIALIEACELIFRVRGGKPEEADYLIVDRVPHRLAADMTRNNWPANPSKRWRWPLPFLPDHLLTQLMGRWFSQIPLGMSYFRDDVIFQSRDEPSCRMRLQTHLHEHAISMDFVAERDKDCEDMLKRLQETVESILDPEGIHRPLDGKEWKPIDLEDLPAVELTEEEKVMLAALTNAMCEDHGIEGERECEEVEKGLRMGFLDSLQMTPAEKLAYRACWAYVCDQCLEQETRFDKALRLEPKIEEMEKVVEWLRDRRKIKATFGNSTGKTLDNADTLRGSYKNAGKKAPPARRTANVGDLERHATRPDHPRRKED